MLFHAIVTKRYESADLLIKHLKGNRALKVGRN
jgi:hypothetical protein